MSSDTRHLDELMAMPFEARLRTHGLWPVTAERPSMLQMNLGYLCNQQCRHCHHESGPERTEIMPAEVMEAAVGFAEAAGIAEFDLTGGAPELHPQFRWLVTNLYRKGARITDRCNLTVLAEPGGEDLPGFLAEHRVHVAASLPCYTPDTTNQVRGDAVFEKSIVGLRMLNDAGYGRSDTELRLTLVHSPSGANLPGRQELLEEDYRERLWDDYGVSFTRLITIANMPIGRFRGFLMRGGELAAYMRRLEQSFNPATVSGLMCRSMLSVGWDGTLYDCDFNQSLGIAIPNATVAHTPLDELMGRRVQCMSHCYGCTAGNGSSCGGEVAP